MKNECFRFNKPHLKMEEKVKQMTFSKRANKQQKGKNNFPAV